MVSYRSSQTDAAAAGPTGVCMCYAVVLATGIGLRPPPPPSDGRAAFPGPTSVFGLPLTDWLPSAAPWCGGIPWDAVEENECLDRTIAPWKFFSDSADNDFQAPFCSVLTLLSLYEKQKKTYDFCCVAISKLRELHAFSPICIGLLMNWGRLATSDHEEVWCGDVIVLMIISTTAREYQMWVSLKIRI